MDFQDDDIGHFAPLQRPALFKALMLAFLSKPRA